MIKVKVFEKDNKIKKVSITGHANFADFGKDIVCAAVSSIVITTVNAIEKLDNDSIKVKEEEFLIEVLSDSSIVQGLLENMITLLKELENDYPKNIRFL